MLVRGTKAPKQDQSDCPGFRVQVGKGREGAQKGDGRRMKRRMKRNDTKWKSIHQGRNGRGVPGSAALGDWYLA